MTPRLDIDPAGAALRPRRRGGAPVVLGALLLVQLAAGPAAVAGALASAAPSLGFRALGATPPPPGSPAAPAGDRHAPPDAESFQARVRAYLLSPEAGVAGLIFEDGRVLRLPPHLGGRLVEQIRIGDTVRVGGRQGGPPDAAAEEPADGRAGVGGRRTVTSLRSGSVLTDAPPAPRAAGDEPAPPPLPTPLRAMTVDGTVALPLGGPRGDTQGVLLDSGVQVSFPPHAARTLPVAALRVGSRLSVDGFGRTTAFGTALQATVVTVAGQPPLRLYAAPPPPPGR